MLWLIAVFVGGPTGSGTESDSDESVPDLEEQDSAQTQTQQAQVTTFVILQDLKGTAQVKEIKNTG